MRAISCCELVSNIYTTRKNTSCEEIGVSSKQAVRDVILQSRVVYIYIGGYFAEYDVVPTCMTFYYPSKIALVRHQITCDPCCRVRRCRRLPLDWGGNGLVSIFCTPGYLTMTPESFKHGVDGRTRFRISLRTLSIMRTYQVRMLFCLFFPRDVAGGRACVTKKK